jgi:hypothetical protein
MVNCPDEKETAVEAKLFMQTTTYKLDDVKRSSVNLMIADSGASNTFIGRQLFEALTKWQAPSDPSTNHNIASDRQHEGTAEWFCEGNILESWKETGSLLWVHGKRKFLYF